MNQSQELKQLSNALAGLASVITEILNDRVKSIPVPATDFSSYSEPAKPCPYLEKKEVADLFQVSCRTIDNWMAKGYLPYYKLGRIIRFKLCDIEAQLDRTCRINRRDCH
jgi:excisionase family DNA binding protein